MAQQPVPRHDALCNDRIQDTCDGGAFSLHNWDIQHWPQGRGHDERDASFGERGKFFSLEQPWDQPIFLINPSLLFNLTKSQQQVFPYLNLSGTLFFITYWPEIQPFLEGESSMKSIYLSFFICGLAISSSLNAASSPTATLDPKAAQQVFGPGRTSLDCSMLINRAWAYPDAQIKSICDEATISCASYGLLQHRTRDVKGQSLQEVQSVLDLSLQVAKMKLVACAQALEVVVTTGETFLKASGYED